MKATIQYSTLATVRFDATDEFAKYTADMFGFKLKELRNGRGELLEYGFTTTPAQAKKFIEWCEV